jgi:hypothetical protein
MADKKIDNLARKPEFHDNDPFAELTRIIGLEPAPGSLAPEDDFVIDLERELLGEFDDVVIPEPVNDTHAPAVDPSASSPVIAAPAPEAWDQVVADDAIGNALADEIDGSWFDEGVADEPVPAVDFDDAAAEGAGHSEADAAAAFDAAFLDMDFDADLTASMEAAAAEAATGWSTPESVAPDMDSQAWVAEEPAGVDEAAGIGPVDAEPSKSSIEAEPSIPENEAFVDAGSPELSATLTGSWIHQLRGRIEREVNRSPEATDEQEPVIPAGLASDAAEPVDPAEGAGVLAVDDAGAAHALEIDLDGELELALQDEVEVVEREPLSDDGVIDPAVSGVPVNEPAPIDPFAELAAMAAAPSLSLSRANLRPLPPVAFAPLPSLNDGIVKAHVPEALDTWGPVEKPSTEEPVASVGIAEPEHLDRLDDDIVFEDGAFDIVEDGHGQDAQQESSPDEGAGESAFDHDAAMDEDLVATSTAAPRDDIPDIETTEISDVTVALADDLDIPEMPADEPAPVVSFDDLDHELGALFGDMPAEEAHQPVAAPASPAPAAMPSMPEDRLRGVVEQAFARDTVAREVANDSFQSSAVWESTAVAGAATAAALAAARKPAPQPFQGFATQPPAANGAADGNRGDAGDAFLDDEFDFETAFADETEITTEEPRRSPRRRSLMLLAGVACVAILGGALAWTWSEDGSSTPVLVRADDGPVKVRPENPGGAIVPNQESQAYQRVSSSPTQAAPAQERLVSTTEEPVDVATRVVAVAPPAAAEEPESVPSGMAEAEEPGIMEAVGAETTDEIAALAAEEFDGDATAPAAIKNEDRIAAMPDAVTQGPADDGALVTPRRVRTMVVRPDGTMVPREEPVVQVEAPRAPAPAPASQPAPVQRPALVAAEKASDAAAPAQQVARPAVASERQAPQPVAAPADAPAAEPAREQVAAATPGAAVTEPMQAQPRSAATPATVPVAPSRPADQPVDIVGEVRRTQVAAAQAAAQVEQPAPAGTWSVQIASQPSAESAQSTYVDLARRYGDVIGGRGVNIVKAEIAGRGTFYRVRIPAATRADANTICARYKTAGGSCFVSQ